LLPLFLLVVSSFGSAQQVANSIGASASAGANVSAIDLQRRSLFEQRASLKRQMGEAEFTAVLATTFYGTIRPLNALSAPACPPLEVDKREDLIAAAARKQAIEPDLLRAVMHHESGFHPCAVSVKGAVGLMQLMPATLAQFHVRDPFDPAQSVHAGAALLRNLLDKYNGDLKSALAAYNAGAARIDNVDPGTYPAETKNYIAGILADLGIATEAPGKPIE
jgi:soluble lytic murein transglycosylase-like protein